MKADTSFKQAMALLRHGDCEEEVNAKLTECLQATMDTGKASTLTIKLSIKPNGNGVVKVVDDIKATVPKFDKEPTVLFTDKNNQLVREDPRQQKLDLQNLEQKRQVAQDLPTQTKPEFKTLS